MFISISLIHNIFMANSNESKMRENKLPHIFAMNLKSRDYLGNNILSSITIVIPLCLWMGSLHNINLLHAKVVENLNYIRC